MFKVLRAAGVRKRRVGRADCKTAASRDADVPLVVRLPVYAASAGLFAVYTWGYLNSGIGGLAWGLVGVTAMSEFLKPQLGELAAKALDDGDRAAQRVVAGAALVCMLLGAGGGVIAIHVAEAPRQRFEAAMQALAHADAEAAGAQRLIDELPACGPDMPASRCARMVAENAPILTERRARLAAAEARAADARATADAERPAGAGLPSIEIWQKALFVGGAEFVMFGVPFACLRLRRLEKGRLENAARPSPAASNLSPPKVNDGGWDARRAKYGPSGRKTKPRLVARTA